MLVATRALEVLHSAIISVGNQLDVADIDAVDCLPDELARLFDNASAVRGANVRSDAAVRSEAPED